MCSVWTGRAPCGLQNTHWPARALYLQPHWLPVRAFIAELEVCGRPIEPRLRELSLGAVPRWRRGSSCNRVPEPPLPA